MTTSWDEAVGEYATAMNAANRGKGTIRLHRHKLAQLSRRHPTPWDVTLGDLRVALANDDWAPETRKSARSVYRGFYKWAHGMGYIEHSPALMLETIRVPLAEPRPAPEAIVGRALLHEDKRIRFMVMLGAFAGLRASEIASVHQSDWDGYRLLVHGKGGKERMLPIRYPMLLNYLGEVEGWAFPGRDGPLTPGHVTRLLSRHIPGIWTAHTLRHRAATKAHDGTKDIFAVSKMLGHSRVETTQRYVRVSEDAIARAMDAAGGLACDGISD